MNEDPHAAQICRQLDEDVARYDAATLSRLNRARQQALDGGLRPTRRPWWQFSLALAGSAAAGVLALALFLRGPATLPPVPDASPSGGDDFEMLAAGEDLEMIENLEFYAWLEQQSLDG